MMFLVRDLSRLVPRQFAKYVTGVYIACAYISRSVREPFRPHALHIHQRYTHARWKRPVHECTRGCVGACNAREMRRTTIQILLLLLREQSPVNRPPRHNVSIQVRSAVLNRSGFTLCESRKKLRVTDEDCRQMCIAEVFVQNFTEPKVLTEFIYRMEYTLISYLPSEKGPKGILLNLCVFIL